MKKIKSAIILELFCLCIMGGVLYYQKSDQAVSAENTNQEFIKWVDFNVSYEALCAAYQWDVDTYGSKNHVDWVDLLAYLAAKNGGSFRSGEIKELAKVAGQLSEGETTISELTKELSYFDYYKEAYGAVLNGYLGEYEMETSSGSRAYEKKYGLKAYLPIAKGFPYSDYDDFGVSRSYGYRRQHLGHDMMGQIGTPI